MFSKYLLSTHYGLGTKLSAKETVVNMRDTVSALTGLINLPKTPDIKQALQTISLGEIA